MIFYEPRPLNVKIGDRVIMRGFRFLPLSPPVDVLEIAADHTIRAKHGRVDMYGWICFTDETDRSKYTLPINDTLSSIGFNQTTMKRMMIGDFLRLSKL